MYRGKEVKELLSSTTKPKKKEQRASHETCSLLLHSQSVFATLRGEAKGQRKELPCITLPGANKGPFIGGHAM